MCDKINFNKIKQGFIYISSDLVIMRHARLWIPGMVISSGEFIISHVSQWPMRGLEKRSLQRGKLKNWAVVAW